MRTPEEIDKLLDLLSNSTRTLNSRMEFIETKMMGSFEALDKKIDYHSNQTLDAFAENQAAIVAELNKVLDRREAAIMDALAARFDESEAKMEAALRLNSSVTLDAISSVHQRLDAITETVKSKFEAIDTRFDAMDLRLGTILEAINRKD